MTNIFRNLSWDIRADNVIYASPAGFIKSYYIYPPMSIKNLNNQFVLALIDNNGFFDDTETTTHNSLDEAKNKAQLHYESILSTHIKIE